jgi:hypothetical protein
MSPEEKIVQHIKLRMSGAEFDSELLPEIADVFKNSIIKQTQNHICRLITMEKVIIYLKDDLYLKKLILILLYKKRT